MVEIPQFEKEQFLTEEPYKWVYSQEGFERQVAIERMKEYANAIGFKGFVKMWNEYFKEKKKYSSHKDLANTTQYTGQKVELYCAEYECDDYGVRTTGRFGEEIEVCPHPILPVMRLQNIDTKTEKLVLSFKRANKAWRQVTVDKSTIASANKIVSLSDSGIAVTSENAKPFVKFLSTIEMENDDDKIPEINSVGRLGWIDEYGFSPYVENLIFDGESQFKHFFESVSQKGSLNKWIEIARQPRKNLVVRMMLAGAFASVLVKPCDALTFFIHLWGGTEAGKTVALMLSASVWANPTMGAYIRTFNATAVSQELSATFVNSMPLIIDELQIQGDRADFDKMIYKLAEGIGKGRGNINGGEQKIGTWQNCILTSGEQPIVNNASKGGAVNRIIEIDCKDEKLFDDPHYIVTSVKSQYGTAGKKFIELLLQNDNIEYAKSVQREFFKKLQQDGDATDKQILSASLILTADRLMNEWFFKDDVTISLDEIKKFLVTKKDVSANERAYDYILDCININSSRFGACEDSFGERWGIIEYDSIEGCEYAYIYPTIFNRLVLDGNYNPSAFLSWSKRRDLIKYNDGKRCTFRKTINGKQIRTVAVRLPSVEDEINDEITDILTDLP